MKTSKSPSKYKASDKPQLQGQNNNKKPIGLFNLVTLMKFLRCTVIVY